MARPWFDERAQHALTTAVAHVEGASAVELALSVRQSARFWLHVPIIAGILGAWSMLAFMLFGEPTFGLSAFLVDPLIAGGIVAWVATCVSPLVRWLTPGPTRRRAVEIAARATFVERGIHETGARTGVLVYCALAERIAVVVADTRVLNAVPGASLAAWERDITSAVRRGGVATAEAIQSSAAMFAAALPRSPDDVNELPDSVEHELNGSQR